MRFELPGFEAKRSLRLDSVGFGAQPFKEIAYGPGNGQPGLSCSSLGRDEAEEFSPQYESSSLH